MSPRDFAEVRARNPHVRGGKSGGGKTGRTDTRGIYIRTRIIRKGADGCGQGRAEEDGRGRRRAAKDREPALMMPAPSSRWPSFFAGRLSGFSPARRCRDAPPFARRFTRARSGKAAFAFCPPLFLGLLSAEIARDIMTPSHAEPYSLRDVLIASAYAFFPDKRYRAFLFRARRLLLLT